MVSVNSVAGMNEDARTNVDTINVPTPAEGQRITVIGSAEHPMDLSKVRRSVSAGSCDLLFSIDDIAVEFDDGQTDFTIPVETGALNLATPDSTNPNNYHLFVGQKLTIDISNVASFTAGLTIQLTTVLTQLNVE